MRGYACNAQYVRRIAQQRRQEIPMSSATYSQLHKYFITTIPGNCCALELAAAMDAIRYRDFAHIIAIS